MVDDITPTVYANIIDDVGRRQYSGKITWLREYIQNAIDSGSDRIEISLHDNDLEVVDHGKGMDNDILIRQAFSIGKPSNETSGIGELGIGMYAGSGICDKISVRTKMKGRNVFFATVDMSTYRKIIEEKPETTFYKAINNILKIEEEGYSGDPDESFTKIRFEGLSRDTIKLIEQEDLKKFLERTANLPISDNFKHKEAVEKFIKGTSREINITLDINGNVQYPKKFGYANAELSDTFWAKDIMDDKGNLIGKLWAVYSKEGSSLDNAGILLKRKGITVGDETYVQSKFKAKYSPRFYGEIIMLDYTPEINASRDWFVESDGLHVFVSKTMDLLSELYNIADFDSREGIGLLNKVQGNEKLDNEAKEQEKKGNHGMALDKKEKIRKNEETIYNKMSSANAFKQKVDQGKIDLSDPTNQLKAELVDRVLSKPEVQKYMSNINNPGQAKQGAKQRRNPWPEIVLTFLKKNLIDNDLAERIASGDIKDTTDRAFTFTEQLLKSMTGHKEQEHVEWRDLISAFKSQYNPPDIKGFPLDEYMQSFNEIMLGMHTILRNPSNHSFMDDMNDSRNLLEVIFIADFIVRWIKQWSKKQSL